MAWAYQYHHHHLPHTRRTQRRAIEFSAYLSESSVRSFCNVLQKPAGLTRVFVACRLLFHGRMTGDRSALIPGIYSYCDRRCERCRFSERCFSFRESVHVAVAPLLETASAAVAGTMSAQCRQPPPVDRSAAVAFLAASRTQEAQDALREEATFNDVLVARSREYALITWRILRTLRPIVDLRGDRQVREALDTAEYFSGMVASKIFRAVWGAAQPEFDAADVQDDANGSAKVARLFIDESRGAWRVLMEVGRASADGVPARLIALLNDLDTGMATRFPRAMDFVRPGFDVDPHAVMVAPGREGRAPGRGGRS